MVFQSSVEGKPHANMRIWLRSYSLFSCDLDLDLVILIYELDLEFRRCTSRPKM